MDEPVKLEFKSTRAGVKPALQGRSKQRQNDLIQAGIKLLCEKSVSEISLIELTAACGYSVGTFYSRFVDKQSFFLAVQDAAVDKMVSIIEDGFSDPKWQTALPREIFENLVNITINLLVSELRGVVRESIIGSMSNKQVWLPIKECGRRMGAIALELLEPYLIKGEEDAGRASILFGLQMFYGTLVQAILNNPGPVKMETPEFRENLIRMLIEFSILKKP